MEDQFDDEAVKEMMEHVDTCIREWNEEHETTLFFHGGTMHNQQHHVVLIC